MKKQGYVTEPAQYKKEAVAQMTQLLKDSPVIGVVNMENLPGPALTNIRKQLRSTATIIMSKRRLMNFAIDGASREGLDQMKAHLGGMPAFIFTKSDPFKIAQMMKKSRSPAPAKPGQMAPRDLIIPAGPTQFTPGPIISELASVGIRTKVENGKLAVQSDVVMVKKGEKVTQKQAEVLAKFGIQPMEVGIDLVAVFDQGLIYGKDVLDIEPKTYIDMLAQASRDSFGLALGVGYFTPETAKHLVGKAFREAKAVALSQGIFADLLAKDLLALADRQAAGLQGKLNI